MSVKRLVLLFAAVALAACSDSTYGSASGCTPTAAKVCSVGGVAFSPVTLTVTAGTTVAWQNGDGVTHTVTNDPASTATFNLLSSVFGRSTGVGAFGGGPGATLGGTAAQAGTGRPLL